MTWLFGQFWILLLIAFPVGALVTYFAENALLPHVDEETVESVAKPGGSSGASGADSARIDRPHPRR
jgi:hypothetical protein